MKKIRLGIVSPYPPSTITLSEYGYHLIKHFNRKEEVSEIVLFSDRLPGDGNLELPEDGCPITVKPCWSFNNWFNFWSILRAVRATKPHIVLFNLQFLSFGDKKIPAALGLMISPLLRLFGYPTVVLLHNIIEEVDLEEAGISRNPIMKALYNFIGRMLTKVILSSNLVGVTIEKYVETLRSKYGKNNVVLLPHGTFEIPPEPDFAVPPGPKQIMSFGKFGTYKKVEIMIEAVEEIRARHDMDLEVIIAGTDNPNVPGYLESVKQQYSHVEGLKFTGYVEEEDVPRIFSESTVVVFPYTSTTGSSGVLHQAGSYGKPCILPDLGDLGRLVEGEGYGGAFFEPDDVNSLADALERVLTDDEYRTRLARKNYNAASGLSLSDITDWYLMHFNKILSAN